MLNDIHAELLAKDFDPSLFNAVANYLALRLNESDAKVIAKIMA